MRHFAIRNQCQLELHRFTDIREHTFADRIVLPFSFERQLFVNVGALNRKRQLPGIGLPFESYVDQLSQVFAVFFEEEGRFNGRDAHLHG